MKDEQINYMLTLTGKQLEFLSNPNNKTSVRILLHIIRNAQKHPVLHYGVDIKTEVPIGICRLSSIEMEKVIGVSKRTINRSIRRLVNAGFLRSKLILNKRIHTILCLNGWNKDGICVANPKSE